MRERHGPRGVDLALCRDVGSRLLPGVAVEVGGGERLRVDPLRLDARVGRGKFK